MISLVQSSSSKPLRIGVYAIARNEESFVRRFCRSARDADHVLIVDTGSSDETVTVAQACGVSVVQILVSPWRFDHARNTALALMPPDIDICISLDLDEVLVEGWRASVEQLWVDGTTRLRYGYDWSQGVVFQAEKIHGRHGYHWHNPCHEVLRPDPRYREQWAVTTDILVSHHPDDTKSRGQYLQLLEVGAKESPHCSRNAIYYARELTFTGLWSEAVVELHRYLQLPDSTWNAERAYAMRLLGDAMEVLGREREALYWYRQGTLEAPLWREPFYHLSKALYRRQQWRESLMAAEAALAVTERPMSYLSEPEAWGAGPHDLAAIASYHTGRYEDARSYGQTALTHAPDDERLANNCRQYDAMLFNTVAFATLSPVSEQSTVSPTWSADMCSPTDNRVALTAEIVS